MNIYLTIPLALIFAAPRVMSQAAPGPAESVTARAATVSANETHTAVERSASGAMSDNVLRVIPINSSYNVGISVVRRSQVDGKTPSDAIVHDEITEVYQIPKAEGFS